MTTEVIVQPLRKSEFPRLRESSRRRGGPGSPNEPWVGLS